MKPTLRLEFHCHTIYSADSMTWPADLVKACRRKGIDRVVISDHNTTAGALVAKDLDPELVIVGEEILTTEGELLAAYVTEELPARLPPQEAVARLRAQGAFISVSHPFDPTRGAMWKVETLTELAPQLDALEVFNARCYQQAYNDKALMLARKLGLYGTAGSDAHHSWELGRANAVLPPFGDAESLREAFKQADYNLKRSPPWVRLFSRYAMWRKRTLGNPLEA